VGDVWEPGQGRQHGAHAQITSPQIPQHRGCRGSGSPTTWRFLKLVGCFELDSFLLTEGRILSTYFEFCPASFRETCQWLKFTLNGLRAQSRVSPVVGLLPLASGPAC